MSIVNKYKGMSPAEAAESISKKYKDRDINTISMKSYEMEMKELAKINKVLKLKEQAKQAMQINKENKMQSALGNEFGDPNPNYNMYNFPGSMAGYRGAMTGSTAGQLDNPEIQIGLGATVTKEELEAVRNGANPSEFDKKPEINLNNNPALNGADVGSVKGQIGKVTNDIFTPEEFSKIERNLFTTGNPLRENNSTPIEDFRPERRVVTANGDYPIEQDNSLSTNDNWLKPKVNVPNKLETLNIKEITSNKNKKLPESKLSNDVAEDEKGGFLNWAKNDAYAPALIGQAVNGITNLGLLAGGYNNVDPVTNPEESKIKNLMAGRGINMDAIRERMQGQANVGRDQARGVRSAQVSQALNQNITNSMIGQEAQLGMQEQQINNQYDAEFANVLNNLGMQDVQATNYAEDISARNRGAWETELSGFSKDIADDSKFFTSKKLNDRYNTMMADILNNKYADFGVSRDLGERISNGTYTENDILLLKQNPQTKDLGITLEEQRLKTLGNG